MPISCFALVASMTCGAKADPTMGTVTLTVAQAPYSNSWGGAIFQGPVVYSSGPVDLGQFFQGQIVLGGGETYQGLSLAGPLLVHWYGFGSEQIPTTFDMKIAFDGAGGSHPTIDVTGPLLVDASSTPDTSSPEWNNGASFVNVAAAATPQSATVQGWTPQSGVPLSLINQFLNTSNYELGQADAYHLVPEGYPTTSTFNLMANRSAVTFVPEPATVEIYLAAIAGLGVRRGVRFRRPRSVR
jgi:hypothetical protein